MGASEKPWEVLAKNSASPKYLFVLNDLKNFFSIIVGLECSVNFLLYSKVTQSHTHIYILFLTFSSILLHRK